MVNSRKLKDYPDVLTVLEVKEILGVGKNMVYKLLTDKKIKARKLGHNWIIAKSNLIEFILSEV